MLTIGSDQISSNYHGIAHTHLDSLAHINDNGVFFNGYKPDADTVLKQGHAKNSIHNLKNGIFTRGILIDIPRLKGVLYLEPGTPIYVEDLEAWEKKAGVRISAGDALFVRTGVWARRKALGPWLRGRAEGGRSEVKGVWIARWWEDGRRPARTLGRVSEMTKAQAQTTLGTILNPIKQSVQRTLGEVQLW